MKKIFILETVSVFFMTMVSCCGQFGNDTTQELATIVKYKDGFDLSDYFHTRKYYLQKRNFNPQMYLTPLTDGYYINFCGGFIDPCEYQDVVVMNFTTDDYANGNIQEDWIEHWEDYVLTENPFMEGGVLIEDYCLKDHGGPWYCKECANTNHVDTTWLNNCIEQGYLWNYAWRRYLDTSAIGEANL